MESLKEKRVALVTGAASGLGRATALALKKDGFFVFGTSRHPTEPSVPTDFPLLQLDVRSDDSVRSAYEHVFALAGHLDVVQLSGSSSRALRISPSEMRTPR